MLNINKIRMLREGAGLTQASLSQISGVSLAFLQRIEYGSANPSVQTMNALLEVLGCQLQIVDRPIDLAAAVAIGVPLWGTPNSQVLPDVPSIIRIMHNLCRHVHASSESRLRTAVEAWFAALKAEFPSIYRRHFSTKFFGEFLLADLTPGQVKLKRIASARLVQIL